jgi:hypothetical protein
MRLHDAPDGIAMRLQCSGRLQDVARRKVSGEGITPMIYAATVDSYRPRSQKDSGGNQ